MKPCKIAAKTLLVLHQGEEVSSNSLVFVAVSDCFKAMSAGVCETSGRWSGNVPHGREKLICRSFF